MLIGLGFLLLLVVESDKEKTLKNYLINALLSSTIMVGGFTTSLGVSVLIPQVIIFTIIKSTILAAHTIHANLGI
ncbi:MAG: hypothetical protein ACFFD2_05445 [Promethearchaeota archaeon]